MGRHAELIALCVECCDSYEPSRMTAFSHVDDFVRSTHPELSLPARAADAAFVVDVALSMERLHALLHLTVDGLYEVHAADISRRSRTLYLVYALLTLDKRALMAPEDFDAFVAAQPPTILLPLLSFLHDPHWQDEWMRPQWSALYDSAFVNDVLLHRLRTDGERTAALLSRLRGAAQRKEAGGTAVGGAEGAAGARDNSGRCAVTVVRPFSLSASRPKALPAPLALPIGVAARPAPPILRQRSLARVEEEKRARRAAITQQLIEAHSKETPFALAAAHRPSSLPRAVAEAEARLKAECAPSPAFSRPSPTAAPAPFHKSTAASILREEERYRRERREEADRLLRFERELRDSAHFDQWQAARRAEDDERRKDEVARRKADMARSHVHAQLSVRDMVERNAQSAAVSKAEAERRRSAVRQSDEDGRRARELRAKQSAAEEERAVAAAVKEALQKRREAAAAVCEEAAALDAERRRLHEEELSEKRALARRIQAMEALAAQRAKRRAVVEDSKAGRLALLSDMSVAEMRRRLELLEEAERRALCGKRERIERQRRTRSDVLQALSVDHAERRRSARASREAQRTAQRRSAEEQSARVRARLREEESATAARLEDKRRRQVSDALALAEALRANSAAVTALTREAGATHARSEADLARAAERRQREERAQAEAAEQRALLANARKRGDLAAWRELTVRAVLGARESAEQTLQAARAEHRENVDEAMGAAQTRVERIHSLHTAVRTVRAAGAALSSEHEARGLRIAQQRRAAEEQWKTAERERLQRASDTHDLIDSRQQRQQPRVLEEKEAGQRPSIDPPWMGPLVQAAAGP